MNVLSFSVTLLALVLSVHLLSQDTILIQKLENELPESKGTTRVDILNSLSWEIKFSDLNTAMKLANESKSLSESLNYEKGLMLSYKNLSAFYFLKVDLNKAEEYIDKALEFTANSEDLYQNGKIFNLKAIISRDLKKTSLALKNQNKALEVFRELGDSAEISGNLHNLAILYQRINEDEKAFELYHEVYEIETRLGNNFGIARTSNNIAGVLIELGFNEKAIFYFNLGVEKFGSIGNLMGKAASLHGLGLVYANLGDHYKAIEYYRKALEINAQNGYNDYLATNHIQMGQSYSELDDYNNALVSYNQSKEIFFKINDLINYGRVLYQISNVYKLMGNENLCTEYAQNALNISKLNGDIKNSANSSYLIYEIKRKQAKLSEAIGYLEDYMLLQDSLKKMDRENLLLELEAKYEFEKVEQENVRLIADSQLSEKKYATQRIHLASVIVIALLLFGLVILIFVNRKKVKLKNKQLQESNTTKDKFFSIIAHDLKNPFSGLLGFSDMLVKNVEVQDRSDLKVYAETIHKSINQTYQLVENLLDWSRSQRNAIEIFKEDLELKEIIEHPVSILLNSAREKKITIVNQVQPGLIIHSDRNILYTILRNLISNAIKFTEINGCVQINAQLRDHGVIVSVSDNGIGIDRENIARLFVMQNGFTTKGTHDEQGTGLGLMLCHEFVEKLNSKIWVESEVGKGSTFSFFLPEKE
jgi:signal transduction histidine kinase/Tfp pilus assembly protein PilF